MALDVCPPIKNKGSLHGQYSCIKNELFLSLVEFEIFPEPSMNQYRANTVDLLRLTRYLMALCPLVLISACGGGGPAATTEELLTGELTPVDITAAAGSTLYQIIEAGPEITFPGNPTLSGNNIDISIDSNFDVSLIDDSGVLQSFTQFDVDNPYNDDLTTWYRNDGRDAFAWQIPFDPSGIPSEVPGLDYTTFGVWVLGASQDTRGDVIGTVEVLDAGIVLLGALTPAGSLPLSGSATYNGSLAAFDADCLIVNDLMSGTAILQADFGLSTVSASLTLNGEDDIPWGTIDSDAMTINASNQFSGNATSSRGHSGTMAGFFTGPAGEEVGGQFDLIREDDNRVVGAFGAADLASR